MNPEDDRHIDELIGSVLEDNVPPDVDRRLRAQLEGFRGSLGAASAANVHRPLRLMKPTVVTRSLNKMRWMMRSPISRATAAAVFVFALAGAALWLHGFGASMSFGQVVDRFLKVQSYQLKVTNLIDDKLFNTYDRVWTAPGRFREESKDKDGVVDRIIIRDKNSERLKETTLLPARKDAHLMEYVHTPEREPFFDEAHRLMLKARENKTEAASLGEKVIEGHRAIGFRLNFEKYSAHQDIWADAETLLPVLIEISNVIYYDKQSSKKIVMKSVWSDIQYNVNPDESLFNLAPPEGYTVSKHKQLVLPKQESESESKSMELSPMNYGPVTPLGEIEEEYKVGGKDGKTEIKKPETQNSGRLAPMGDAKN